MTVNVLDKEQHMSLTLWLVAVRGLKSFDMLPQQFTTLMSTDSDYNVQQKINLHTKETVSYLLLQWPDHYRSQQSSCQDR